jgi:hypothetical protein
MSFSFKPASVQKLADEDLSQFGIGNSDALWDISTGPTTNRKTHLFDDIGAELLNRQDTDVADELTDQGLAESNIVQVEDV